MPPRTDRTLVALDDIDVRRVALPTGTEVVTRIDRVSGERRVPQGTIGRVVATTDAGVVARFVGVGDLTFDRDDLSARREGQALFAVRRAAAWDALKPCVVLRTRVGSHAWGLADERSDEDERGVFAHPFEWRAGLVAPPEDLVSESGSETYWSVEKAIRQGLRADPNTLEMLYVPGAEALDPIGAWLLAERDAFVSREMFGSFGRYALAQLDRLNANLRLHRHRTLLLDWLRTEPTIDLDTAATRLAAATNIAVPTDGIGRARQHIKQLYRSLFDQGLLGANDFASFVTFASRDAPTLDLPRELRPKNAYNLLRLVHTALRWLRDGAPTFRFDGALLERLRSIKNGLVDLDSVLTEAQEAASALDAARATSPLPERTDLARADRLQRRIVGELARRHVNGVPGPFGRDAPPVADAGWADR